LGWGDSSRKEIPNIKNFNSFTYLNAGNRQENATDAIGRGMQQYFTLPKDEKNKIISRIIQSSRQFDWNALDGPIDQINIAYQQTMKRRTSKEIEDTKKEKHRYINFSSSKSKEFLETLLENAHSRNLPNIELIDFAEQNFALKDPLALSLEVRWQILHLAEGSEKFGFKHLPMNELAVFYRILNSFCLYEENKKGTSNLRQYASGIEDHIFKLCEIKDINQKKELLNFITELEDKNDVLLSHFIAKIKDKSNLFD